jgi:hypothetical protein
MDSQYRFFSFDRSAGVFLVHGFDMELSSKSVQSFSVLMSDYYRQYAGCVALAVFYERYLSRLDLSSVCGVLASNKQLWRDKFNAAVDGGVSGMFRELSFRMGDDFIRYVQVRYNGRLLSGVSPWDTVSPWGQGTFRVGDLVGVVRVPGYIDVFNELFGVVGSGSYLYI